MTARPTNPSPATPFDEATLLAWIEGPDALPPARRIEIQAALDAKVAEVVTILKPLLQAVGDTANPLTGDFKADGTGHDKVLDAVQVDIHTTATAANIEITVKSATDTPIAACLTRRARIA